MGCMETKTDPASFAGNNNEVTTGELVADRAEEWGVRWPTQYPDPEGHTYRWYESEAHARQVANHTRGDAQLVRRVVVQFPAEVIA